MLTFLGKHAGAPCLRRRVYTLNRLSACAVDAPYHVTGGTESPLSNDPVHVRLCLCHEPIALQFL